MVLVLAAAPLVMPVYWTIILTEIFIMGLFAMSFNLLLGYTGLLSFGQAGFFGVGAYAAALLILNNCSSLGLILAAGILGGGVAAAVIGYFCVKRDEIYFAMITLGFGMMLYTIAHNWIEVTGGSDGLPVSAVPAFGFAGLEIQLAEPRNMYLFVLAVSLGEVYLLWRLVRSPFGLLLSAVRENKERLAFVGANVAVVRLVSFTIAGALAGLAGGLFCLFNCMATPDFMHWSYSARPVLMTILGGSGIFLGPACGAAIFFVLEQLITNVTENWMIVLGAILIPVVVYFPRGILGTVWARLHREREGGRS
ncbi:MAG: branched-chain amino acid ABC transporter permease [Deltaproteobacteria bacterium]|nr:branched-chain amino acid ABC transporter permease [Candidatus Anaeroferrophillacea bacterium]